MGQPVIDITFKQKAISAVKRSSHGIACIVVDDSTSTETKVCYKTSNDFTTSEQAKYTTENKKAIKQAFIGGPAAVYVVRIGATGSFDDIKTILDTIKFNWLCYVADESVKQTAVSTYIKNRNTASKNKKYKAVVFDLSTSPNDEHIVNFANENVTFTDDAESTSGEYYLPSIVGFFAGMPFTESATYKIMSNLKSVKDVSNIDTAIDSGKFVLFNDDGVVRANRAVTSLTTIVAPKTDDMKKITIVEAMDMIVEDITNTYKNNYVGKYKNKYDNQCLFISAVDSYFDELEKEDVLDPDANNEAYVNCDAQRKAWIDSGKTEAELWDDITVKKNSFKSNMYLGGSIKILDAIEDLSLVITM